MTEVVAALIWHGEKFMICQRPENKARGLLWEFVGSSRTGRNERTGAHPRVSGRACRNAVGW